MCTASFNGWVSFDADGNIEQDMSGIGYIYGLHYNSVEDIFKNTLAYFEEGILEGFTPKKNSIVEFNAINILYQEGQMSFPETCQWDFPPHWEMDIEITNIQYYTDEGEPV